MRPTRPRRDTKRMGPRVTWRSNHALMKFTLAATVAVILAGCSRETPRLSGTGPSMSVLGAEIRVPVEVRGSSNWKITDGYFQPDSGGTTAKIAYVGNCPLGAAEATYSYLRGNREVSDQGISGIKNQFPLGPLAPGRVGMTDYQGLANFVPDKVIFNISNDVCARPSSEASSAP